MAAHGLLGAELLSTLYFIVLLQVMHYPGVHFFEGTVLTVSRMFGHAMDLRR